MPDTQLNIWLKLRDTISKPLQGIKLRLKSFATSFKQHWIAITASITAAIMALRKAWDLAELGVKAEQVERSFTAMADTMNINAERMKRALMDVSAQTVNFSNVADKVSALMAQGLNMDTIVALMRQARAEAKIFGKTTEETFSVIASAVTGGLVTTLRRAYGLQLSLKDATEDYAKATGKTIEEVQKYYLAQAIANHILQRGASHLKAVNLGVISQHEQIQRLRAQWVLLRETIGQILMKIAVGIEGVLRMAIAGFYTLANVFRKFFSTIILGGQKIFDLMGKLPGIMGKTAKRISDTLKKVNNEIVGNIKNREKIIENQVNKTLEIYTTLFGKVEETSKNANEIIANSIKNSVDKAKDAIDNTKENVKETFNAMEEFAKQAASNIENAFANFFFKTFTGQLRGLKEVFAGFGRAMLQVISNILAKALAVKIFKSLGLSSLLGFQTGTPFVPHTGLYLLHKGEKVTPAHEAGKGEGVTVNINQFIQAWDAQDIWRNRKALAAGIVEELRFGNPGLRNIMKDRLS